MDSWEKDQARLLKIVEEMNSGSSNSESESDADSAENNNSDSEDDESTTDEEYEAPEEPENDETWHTNTTSNRKGLPQEITRRKLRKGEHVWRRQNQTYVSKWKDKRDVLCLTTAYHF
ncbi:hypothetical protein GJ496_001403 [Pomphorhynchus laevis]|nr:hypothetical protein GJ496_001403 [Pomphorhynchus laevis]